MTKRSRPPARTRTAGNNNGAEVESFLAALEHPHVDAIRRVRALVRSVDPRIVEELKWNAPSFALDEHFATFQLRAKTGVMLVMHFGVKKRTKLPARTAIADPARLLTWLADDRATITFADLADVETKRATFVSVVRAWIAARPD